MSDFVCTFPGEEWSPVISARDPEHAAETFSAQAFGRLLPPDRLSVEVRSASDSSITWKFTVTQNEQDIWVALEKAIVDSGLSAADLVSDSTPPYASLLLCNRAANGRVTMWLGKRLLFQIDPGPIDALAEALSLLLGSTGTGESFSFNLGTGEVIDS